jgi:hypothetical protein
VANREGEEAVRTFFEIVAMLMTAVGVLASIFGGLEMSSGSTSAGAAGLIAGLAFVLLSGIVYLLSEIAERLHAICKMLDGDIAEALVTGLNLLSGKSPVKVAQPMTGSASTAEIVSVPR